MKNKTAQVILGAMTISLFIGISSACLWANTGKIPFAPGEKLEYQMRWENIPAGSVWLEVLPVNTINGLQVYHFAMVVESNAFVDIFYKIRDRIDAFADIDMTRSVHFVKKQHEGGDEKNEVIEFDWENGVAHYSNFGQRRDPISLMAGSFDPLSAFYYSRTMSYNVGHELERPITDGQKNVIGRLRVVGRETIQLLNGKSFDTYRIEPEMSHVGGVFDENKGAKIQLWVTADENRIPVRIQSKVAVGHFIGELVSVNGNSLEEAKAKWGGFHFSAP